MRKIKFSFILLLSILLSGYHYSVGARSSGHGAVSLDKEKQLTEEERFQQFVVVLKQKALQEGISSSVIDKAFAQVHLLKRVIQSDKKQLEKEVSLSEYLGFVLSKKKIERGFAKMESYQRELAIQAERYQVPVQYIVALWGVESGYGRLQGKEDVISALTTLAFEGRRKEFFTQQLMYALTILQEKHISLAEFKGSWAGAMGQSQFMPSSFLRYGADGDGDGKIDIWNNEQDVFASIANYLFKVGWDSNLPWGEEVRLPADFDMELAGLEEGKSKTVQQWQKIGVKLRSNKLAYTQVPTWIIIPNDDLGRVFLVYSNFNTLMDWNRSYHFAISVGMLADTFAAQPTKQKNKPIF